MFVLYSSEQCGQCKQAKLLLDMKGKEYEVKMVEDEAIRAELKEKAPSRTSLPVIFKDGELIGGLLDLKKLIK